MSLINSQLICFWTAQQGVDKPEGIEGWTEMKTEDKEGLEIESPEGAEALSETRGVQRAEVQQRLYPGCHYPQYRAGMGRLPKP